MGQRRLAFSWCPSRRLGIFVCNVILSGEREDANEMIQGSVTSKGSLKASCGRYDKLGGGDIRVEMSANGGW